MVRKTFGIYSEELSASELFIETGDEYLACWCRSDLAPAVTAFELFTFKETERQAFASLLNEIRLHSRLLTTPFEQVSCIWTDEKCICVPGEYFDETSSASYLQLMLGENPGTQTYDDRLGDYHLLAVLPQSDVAALKQFLPVHSNVHKYAQLLKGQQTEPGNTIHMVFYYSWFIISVYRDQSLQLIQKYSYRVPEDALYYLLSICKSFGLPPDETKLYVSGMIDTASSLYETIRGYVQDCAIEPFNRDIFAAEAFHEYPLHYFASFCQYAV